MKMHVGSDLIRVLTAALCLLGLSAPVNGAEREPGFTFTFPDETYTQELQVVLTTEDAAGQAALRILPLYAGYDWAFSCRWDDNLVKGDLAMRDVMEKHGYRGNWYLNEPGRGGMGAETARQLLNGGNSIGSHSLTHPYLPYQNRNRIFEELGRSRAQWEAAVDRPVISFAFAYLAYAHRQLPLVTEDIYRSLGRAGYYHVPLERYGERWRKSKLVVSPLLPGEGSSEDRVVDAAEKALASEAHRRKHAHLSFAMHARYSTPEDWASFESLLDRYGGRPNWWYCNQNQYAAYRYQFLNSRLDLVARDGEVLRYKLVRHRPIDLGDMVPLTLEVSGVGEKEVGSVTSPRADCAPVAWRGGAFRFHLLHDRDRSLPERIGLVENADNHVEMKDTDVDPDFPDVRVLLRYDDGTLRLVMKNEGDATLRRMCLTYRLPLAFGQDALRRVTADLAPGDELLDEIEPTVVQSDYAYHAGAYCFLVQIDFVQEDKAGRLHATCRVEPHERDGSYPQGGFLRLGPIPVQECDLDALSGALTAGGVALIEPWQLKDGRQLAWTREEGAMHQPFLSPEILRTTGRWYSRIPPSWFVFRSKLHTPVAREVSFVHASDTVKRIIVNGGQVEGDRARLRKGTNSLLLIYREPDQQCTFEKAGCLFRIVAPGSRKRITDIRFETGLTG